MEDMVLFIDNDHGGHNKPLVQSKFPIVHPEIMDFFHVGPDCKCRGDDKIIFRQPEYRRLPVPEAYGYIQEPLYIHESQPHPSRPTYETIFRGDDYGGHNIPFPHPKPPLPHKMYDRTAFVEVDRFYKGEVDYNSFDLNMGVYSLDLTGFGSYKGHGLGSDIDVIVSATHGFSGYG